jgi:hypothetical protein
MKTPTKVRSVFFFINLILLSAPLVKALAEGNHTWAKSEAWTWMGHVRKVDMSQPGKFLPEGYAFIHYFTRNETGTGRMNFKSSAVTITKNDVGVEYDKKTIFPNGGDKQFQLRVQEKELNIEFLAPGQRDSIKEVPMQVRDFDRLQSEILPLYPGLKIAPQWTVKKFYFSAYLGSRFRANMNFYAIWPDIAPPDERMEFFGLYDSFTYSSPMLVTVGEWAESDGPFEKVVGLSFLDRQWSRDYFGKNIFSDPRELIKKQHALKMAHNWSAFHAYAPTSQDWYFVHLWQQVDRSDEQPDRRRNYTGVQWSKNGVQQQMIDASSFSWEPRKFVRNQSKVLMNFAEGREDYFPFQYYYQNNIDASNLLIEASPRLQSLDQPIYLYEGYARGSGKWDGQDVVLQGRVESSQILFRDVDYESMLNTIDSSDPTQSTLAHHLSEKLERERRCLDSIAEEKARQRYLFNDLFRKIQIFGAQFQSKPERLSSQWVVYY